MIPATDAAAAALKPLPIFLEGRLPVLEATTAKQLGLRDGQVIQANVQSQGSQWLLRFQNGTLLELPREGQTQPRWPEGSSLTFRVVMQSDGSILLRPMRSADAAPTVPPPSTGSPTVVPDRMAQLLFRPQDLKGLQELLQPGVLETMARQMGEMPGPLAQWLRNRPSAWQLSGEQLKNWIAQSGWFAEVLLGKGKWNANADLKTALKALLLSVRDAGDGTAQQIENALEDLESGQLNQALAHGRGDLGSPWLLAFRDAPPIRMNVSREPGTQEQASRGFVVEVGMDPPDLGSVWLRTKVLPISDIEMIMWAERAEVAELARREAPHLRQQLSEAGLNLRSFQIVHGKAPERAVIEDNPGQLLDIRT